MASLPGAVPAGADQPGRMSALVWAALTVGLYAVYVACVVVPDARAEMALTVAWGRDVSDLRWQRTDQWTELASGRIDSSLKLEVLAQPPLYASHAHVLAAEPGGSFEWLDGQNRVGRA